ncbi:MAG TPA: cytochrome P450 [Solirubrobacter sp.]
MSALVGERHGLGPSDDGEISLSALEQNPYPIYRRLRDEAPVCHVPAVELTLVTRWEDVHHVARHPELFTADVGSSPLTRTLGQNMLTVDGGEQRRIRATIDPAMRPRVVAGYAPAVIEPIAERHLAAIEPDGAGELMATYCEPVSVLALGSVMGLGDADADTLRRWFGALALGGSNFESDPDKQAIADAASAEVDDRVLPLLDRLEQEPDGSVLSDMLHVQPPDGERLSKPEVLANLKLILLGGMQEPGHALGIALWALLQHPDALAEVRAHPQLLDGAVEEALRWHSPVGTQTRQVTERTDIAGVTLEPGTVIAAVLASANQDERHWQQPERFDIHRTGAHAAFGLGAHHCAGASLARHEVRLPLRLILERLPRLRTDPEQPVELSGWEFRAPLALFARWD